MRRIVLILLAAAGVLPAQIQITGLEGLAEKAKEVADISLTRETLESFLQLGPAKGQDEAKLRAALAAVKSITVKAFEFDRPGQYDLAVLDGIRAQLSTQAGWTPIVRVREPGEIAEIYVKTEQGRNAGIAILAGEATELTIVVIDGTISLSDLSALEALGVPQLGGNQQKKQDKKGKEE
jgi:hypothetical protein